MQPIEMLELSAFPTCKKMAFAVQFPSKMLR